MQNTCRKMWLWSVSGPDFLHWQLEFLNISGRWFLLTYPVLVPCLAVVFTFQKLEEECLIPNCFHLVVTHGSMDVLILTRPACRGVCLCVCVYKTWLLQHVVGTGLSSAMSGPHNEWHSSHGNTSARQWVGQWWARSTPQRCHSFHSGNGSRSKPEEPEGMKVQRFKSVWQWTVTEREELHLTWAIIPIKAHSLNIFRGTLTRYWRINTKHFLKHISNGSNNLKLLTCLFEFYDTSWQQ